MLQAPAHSATLAIVIPAYKGEYLRDTLEALAAQTDTRFAVYIGNDAGSTNIDELVASYQNRLSIHYQRFSDNLGGKDLVAQWNRCLAMTQQEPWIWLLPDDDVPDTSCVAAFYTQLEQDADQPSNLYRFNTSIINGAGVWQANNSDHPELELPGAFLYARLIGDRYSTVCEYIFNRQVFESAGGFKAFPLAWFTDDATWIRVSGGHPIKTIAGPRVQIRQSEHNISNITGTYGVEKARAVFQYLRWLKQLPKSFWAGFPTDISFRTLSQRFVRLQLQGAGTRLGWIDWFALLIQAAKLWGATPAGILEPMFDFNPTGITRKKIGGWFQRR